MREGQPNLHLVDAQTGEVVEDEREILIQQLQDDLKGKNLAIGKLKKELRELHAVEPEAETVRGILTYCHQRIGRPKLLVAPGGKRWEKVRARLRDKLDGRPSWTPHELMLAADGALLDPWISGKDRNSKGYLDSLTIYRDAEQVEKLRDLAIGFEAEAGVNLGDLLDATDAMRWVNWKFLLRICTCGHRRIEHSRMDPSLEGREGCYLCECDDFGEDLLEEANNG